MTDARGPLEHRAAAVVDEAFQRRRAERDAKYTAARLAPPPFRPSELEELEDLVWSDVKAEIPALTSAIQRERAERGLSLESVSIVADDAEDLARKTLEAEMRLMRGERLRRSIKTNNWDEETLAAGVEAVFLMPGPRHSTYEALGAIARVWAPKASEVLERFALRDLADVIAELEIGHEAMKRRDPELRSLVLEHGVPHQRVPSQHPKIVALIRDLWASLAPVLASERARGRMIAKLLSAAVPGWIGTWQTVRLVVKPRSLVR